MKKIMIVDDSLIIRIRLRDLFESIGFKVVAEAESGEKAISKFKEIRPDIVTMDIILPGIDGIEVVEKLIEIDPEVKIIMLSGAAQRAMVVKAVKAGALNYIIKPFNEAKVIKVVYEVLGLDPAEEENRLREADLNKKSEAKSKEVTKEDNKESIEENDENVVQ